jgi:hypothetical protein
MVGDHVAISDAAIEGGILSFGSVSRCGVVQTIENIDAVKRINYSAKILLRWKC